MGKPDKDAVLSAAVQKILKDSSYNDSYGIQRMQLALAQDGHKAGLRRITRIMRNHGWLHERRRRPKGLTKATTEAQEKENLLKQDFSSSAPFQKVLTDITQVQCRDGKLYISPILDCYNGEILSMIMRDNMRKELCVDTVRAACHRFPLQNAILHSDRGSQYTSEAFRNELRNSGIKQSLSGVDRCFDNARMESFFATLKKELIYRIPSYRMTREEVRREVFRYVFTYYNRKRVYTANPGGMAPSVLREAFEEQQLLAA